MPSRTPRVCFGEGDVWEHALWDAAEVFEETTISAAFQQQLAKSMGKMDQELHRGLERIDQKLLEITALLQRFEPPGSPPQEGISSDVHSMLVVPARSRAKSVSPKSWASPFQDSVEFLRTASERDRSWHPARISIFTIRRADFPVKEALWDFLVDPLSSYAAWWFCILYGPLVMHLNRNMSLSVTCILLESAWPDLVQLLLFLEIFLDLPFLAEVLARFMCTWSCYRYVSSVCNMIDLLALASIPLSILSLANQASDGVVLLKWTVFPALKMMKLCRFCPQLEVISTCFADCRDGISMILLICSLELLLFGCSFYASEQVVVQSLPEALYYILLIMTTVGSNIVPSTTAGKLISSLAVFCSIFAVVVSLSVLGTCQWQDRDLRSFARQLRRSLKDWGFPEQFFEKVIMDFDRSGVGRLSLEDFDRLAQELHVSFKPQRLVPVFYALDIGQNGYVEVSELLKLLLPSRRRWGWAEAPTQGLGSASAAGPMP